jgi:hypothetical protein
VQSTGRFADFPCRRQGQSSRSEDCAQAHFKMVLDFGIFTRPFVLRTIILSGALRLSFASRLRPILVLRLRLCACCALQTIPFLAVLQCVTSFQGQLFSLAHFSIPKWPPSTALEYVPSSQGQLFSLDHFSIVERVAPQNGPLLQQLNMHTHLKDNYPLRPILVFQNGLPSRHSNMYPDFKDTYSLWPILVL